MHEPSAAFFEALFARSPVGMTVYDEAGQCVAANDAICAIIGATMEQVLAQSFHHIDSWQGSGLLDAALEALATERATHKKVTLVSTFGKELTANANFLPFEVDGTRYLLFTFDDLSEVKKVEDEREKLIVELRAALEEIQALRSILPLCSFCKKIRDDKGYWEQVDVYIHKHLFAEVSHSLCPDCVAKHYPEDV